VYITRKAFFVISQVMTDHGRVSAQPMLQLGRSAADEEIGSAVLRCLEAYSEKDGPPSPDHFNDLKHFLRTRSWKPFVSQALNVAVEGPTTRRVLLAAARADKNGAFAYGPAQPCARDATAIGAALRRLAKDSAI
jgi:hypothetical protein